MARTIETECAECGESVEVDISNDPGADRYSVEQADIYCGWSCEEAAY